MPPNPSVQFAIPLLCLFGTPPNDSFSQKHHGLAVIILTREGEMVWISHTAQYNMTLLGAFRTVSHTQRSPSRIKCHAGSRGRMDQWNDYEDLLIAQRWILRGCEVGRCGAGEGSSPFKEKSGRFQKVSFKSTFVHQDQDSSCRRESPWRGGILEGEDPAKVSFRISNAYGINLTNQNTLQTLL